MQRSDESGGGPQRLNSFRDHLIDNLFGGFDVSDGTSTLAHKEWTTHEHLLGGRILVPLCPLVEVMYHWNDTLV